VSITHAGLRSWARGLYPLEAAVELLVRANDGRFANPGYPWIQPCDQPGWWWLDHQAITDDNLCALSGGEQRILRVVASLAGGTPVNLYADLPGLDRDHMSLVLAAVAHANGSHEHAGIRIGHERGVAVLDGRLPSLHPWPEPAEGEPNDHRTAASRPAAAARPSADSRGAARRDRTAPPRRGLAF